MRKRNLYPEQPKSLEEIVALDLVKLLTTKQKSNISNLLTISKKDFKTLSKYYKIDERGYIVLPIQYFNYGQSAWGTFFLTTKEKKK